MTATYRDDIEAARQRRDSLARELAEVESRLEVRQDLEARARDLKTAIADAAQQMRQARIRAKLPLLDVVTISTPCTQSWDEMVGDDRQRFCGKCERNVYDLSEMTAKQAEALLAASGETPCLRIHRRPDGTVMTKECPEGKRRRRRRKRAAIAAALLVGGSLAAAGTLMISHPHEPLMGAMEVAVPQPPPPPLPPEKPPEALMGQAKWIVGPEAKTMGTPPPRGDLEQKARTRAHGARRDR